MALTIYNEYTKKKEEFTTVREGRVGIYFCGMTVQDEPHMGHMLAFVAGDMIRRYLAWKGYDVTYVQNFTDVDDKIIARANDEGVEFGEVAGRNIEKYFRAAETLNILPADVYPKATEHIGDIISFVERLIDKGCAYASGGDVYYRVRTFGGYGKLSGRRIDELRVGARIEAGEGKEDPLDFTLWKGAKPGEPAWDSPWGRGRPGWHIECSVMSTKYLGDTLDMHGGGLDLIFPHHENEIAQSEAATGSPFVRYWMHNGLLNLKGEKMSKSTGHFFSIADITKEFSGEVVRFYLLSTHFRSNAEFSRERLEEAAAGLDRIRNVCRWLDESRRALDGGAAPARSTETEKLAALAGEVKNRFEEAMDDDFNSAEAIGHVFRLVRELNRFRGEGALLADRGAIDELLGAMTVFDRILGLFRGGLPAAGAEIPGEVAQLAEERVAARAAKNWAEADRLRDEIAALGWIVEDRPDGYALKPGE
ncbi:MAG: cysteine--tRNA ligase [Candidatus Krumholzibacteriota bacterium]|nr:cysteine--tRNA ligase [Candidatus Krumholzibacteriota bacterium]